MPERLSPRQVIALLCVLIGIFILIYIFLPRFSTPFTSSTPSTAQPATQPALATATPPAARPTLTAVPTLGPEAASRCREQIRPFLAQSDPLVSEWVDSREQADQVPLEGLPAEIEQLKSVRQRVRALQVPECVGNAFLRLLLSMDHAIEAYQGFVDQLPEGPIREDFDQASELFTSYVEQLSRVR